MPKPILSRAQDILIGFIRKRPRLRNFWRFWSSLPMNDKQPWTLARVKALDVADDLAKYRTEFNLPDDVIYLDGNSLGALPKRAQTRVRDITEKQWGQDLISSWNTHDWVSLPITVGEKIAPLIGAASGQVVCCDSISVNLFKLLSAAIRLNGTPTRTKIISSHDNFPTDLYIAQGLQGLLGE